MAANNGRTQLPCCGIIAADSSYRAAALLPQIPVTVLRHCCRRFHWPPQSGRPACL